MVGEKETKHRFFKTEQAVLRLKRYVELMDRIIQEEFTAPFLIKLKGMLVSGGIPASRQVRNLMTIAEHSNLRYSNALIYFPLNIVFLWDLRTLRRMNRWQKRWGGSVRGWFEATGEIEALSSLAGLCHDNPHWAFPGVREDSPAFLAESLGHPLIPAAERVANDLSLACRGTVFIITGSNMSGKSTLLRTVGINLVLAYAGAPVCAHGMTCSHMRIYSKMQVHDNLEERVSTFYAELKRMKMIIDAAKSGDPLIFLLDEIFRGTNSRDRIIATRTVIRQLHKLNTIGLISTHDLELGSLEKEFPGLISNYHFDDDIKNGRIHFDFRLKPGISQTANAIALMRMIGIQVEEGEIR
jgi:DNA mismatch repair ATPase MutS